MAKTPHFNTPLTKKGRERVETAPGHFMSAAALRFLSRAKKEQDKGVPPQAAALRPLLPAVRAVCGERG